MIGLVEAEMDHVSSKYPGTAGRIGWLELPGFRVLIRVRLDDAGAVEHIDFFGVREK